MPVNYRHELTATEIECGVTIEDVQRELPRVLLQGNRCYTDAAGPALAGSVARAAFAGPVIYIGQNTLGHSIFEPVG